MKKGNSRSGGKSMLKCERGLEVSSHRILKARATLQIPIKRIRDIQNTLDVLHAERFALVDGECLSGSNGVLDLF